VLDFCPINPDTSVVLFVGHRINVYVVLELPGGKRLPAYKDDTSTVITKPIV
jgi:hypothetical protein